jgi:SHS2 domain-containing protein
LAGYTFLEHTTDALIKAEGATLEEAFANAARGLTDTMVHIATVKEKIEEQFTVQGSDLENLLYNWLETLLIKVTTEGTVFSTFNLKVRKTKNGYELTGTGRGEELNIKRHKPKTEVKAATYHLMKIEQKNGQVTLQFLLDL